MQAIKVDDLLQFLEYHKGKGLSVAVPVAESDAEGNPGVVSVPFEVVQVKDQDLILIILEEPPKPFRMTRTFLAVAIPHKHLKLPVEEQRAKGRAIAQPCELEKIHEDVNKIVEYLEQHNVMSEIDQATGQKNDIRYWAHAIQAYYQGKLPT